MPSHPWSQRALGLIVAVVLCLGLAMHGQALQTEIPPTDVPTVIPPTVIPPTDIPPTDVPVTEVPTEVPTEAPTEQPTEQPTEEPTDTPEPFPTDIPATPTADAAPPPPPQAPVATTPPQVRETQVTCGQPDAGDATPASTPAVAVDTGDWVLLRCTIAIDASGMDRVQVRATSTAPGWRVILVEEDAPNTPGLLDASNNLVTYTPDPESTSIAFLLGYQRSCTGLAATRLVFEVSGSVDGSQRIRANANLSVDQAPTPMPVITIDDLWVDTEREPAPTSIRLGWTSAPDECDWTLRVTLIESGDTDWALVRVSGADDVTGAIDGTVVTLSIPAGESPEGSVVLTLVPSGDGEAQVESVQAEAFTWP